MNKINDFSYEEYSYNPVRMGFAAEYNKTPEGWIKFPPDKPIRETLFHEQSFIHPARANLWMLQEIYHYVAEPGETLLDITAGIGSLMMACLEGHQVILIELNKEFHRIQMLNAYKMGVEPIMLLGDCRDYLPMSCDHIIFSPPYSTAYTGKGSKKMQEWTKTRQDGEMITKGVDLYRDDDPKNLGLLNIFLFGQQMEKIYEMCLESVRPGGTMTIIIQDCVKGGEMQQLGDLAMRQCLRMGWELKDWFYRWQPGTPFKSQHKKKGHLVTEKEDIIILQRPQ